MGAMTALLIMLALMMWGCAIFSAIHMDDGHMGRRRSQTHLHLHLTAGRRQQQHSCPHRHSVYSVSLAAQ